MLLNEEPPTSRGFTVNSALSRLLSTQDNSFSLTDACADPDLYIITITQEPKTLQEQQFCLKRVQAIRGTGTRTEGWYGHDGLIQHQLWDLGGVPHPCFCLKHSVMTHFVFFMLIFIFLQLCTNVFYIFWCFIMCFEYFLNVLPYQNCSCDDLHIHHVREESLTKHCRALKGIFCKLRTLNDWETGSTTSACHSCSGISRFCTVNRSLLPTASRRLQQLKMELLLRGS